MDQKNKAKSNFKNSKLLLRRWWSFRFVDHRYNLKFMNNSPKLSICLTLAFIQLLLLVILIRRTGNFSLTFQLAKTPIILHWTPYFHDNHLTEFFRDFPACKYKCIYTEDKTLVDKAKAIVFHSRHTNTSELPPDNPNQLRVYFTFESPEQTWFYKQKLNASQLVRPDYFNLTVNYRTKSDILMPYGYFRPLDGKEHVEELWSEWEMNSKIAKKSRLVLTAVSHCFTLSKREKYTEALRKYVNVTQIGKCTPNKECITAFHLDKNKTEIWSESGEDCLQRLTQDHFFYLAFENSVCPEYATEKFYRLYNLIVPIVLSRAAMPSHIPPDSYVAASDFRTVEEMAKFLEQKASNLTEYKKFFNWTKKYRKLQFKFWHGDESCQLCELLHKNKGPRQADFRTFMNTSVCHRAFGHRLAINDHRWVSKREDEIREVMRKESFDRPWYFT